MPALFCPVAIGLIPLSPCSAVMSNVTAKAGQSNFWEISRRIAEIERRVELPAIV